MRVYGRKVKLDLSLIFAYEGVIWYHHNDYVETKLVKKGVNINSSQNIRTGLILLRFQDGSMNLGSWKRFITLVFNEQ